MITAITRFPIPAGFDNNQVRAAFAEAAHTFQSVPKLVRKQFLLSTQSGTAGGVYLWEDEQAARAFLAETVLPMIRKKFRVEPTLEFFESPIIVENAGVSAHASQSRKHGSAKYRHALPQLGDQLFMSDGGLETTLIFHEKLELPLMAAFPLVQDEFGREKMLEYFRRYCELARRHRLGFILESPTWRANPDWVRQISADPNYLAEINRASIELMERVRDEYSDTLPAIVISGCIGPRGDGYVPSRQMSVEEAERYHLEQIRVFADTAADLVSAFTLNYVEEAIGITRAALHCGIPVVISFTVETDGKLPTGQTLKEAIESVDAATNNGPAYFMINCSHPTHFIKELKSNEAWVKRIRAIRANASRCSHAELNDSQELDTGDPVEIGEQYAELRALMPHLSVIGGCCGTDHRHVAAMCEGVLRSR